MEQSETGTGAPYGLPKGEVQGTGCVAQGLEKQLGAAQMGGGDKSLREGSAKD